MGQDRRRLSRGGVHQVWMLAIVIMMVILGGCGTRNQEGSGGAGGGGGDRGASVVTDHEGNEAALVGEGRLGQNGDETSIVAPPPTANTCTSGPQCPTGNCVDGFCCDIKCDNKCMACSAAKKGSGVDGVCGSITFDTDPDNDCPNGSCDGKNACKNFNGNPCTSTAMCLSNYCVDGFCCGNICMGACQACSAAKKGTGSNGVCGSIAANTDPDNECNPGECNSSGVCNASPQPTSANGAACTSAAQCASGYCADGVCCDSWCLGNCQACTAAKKGSGADGTCGNIGYDRDPDEECWGGGCNGSGVCKQYNGVPCTKTVQCLSNYCVDGVCCGNICTGMCYACSEARKGQGFDGVCGAIASGKDPDSECTPGECNGSGTCNQPQTPQVNGTVCASSGQCVSGNCIDGVCCDTTCTGICSACTAVKKGSGVDGTCGPIAAETDPESECGVGGKCGGNGTCRYYNGVTCTSTAQCFSNYCVDGVCCGNICTSTCYACSAIKKGQGADGSCGPIANTKDPDNECNPGECNGSGACNQTQMTQPNGAVCTVATQCASGFCVDGYCCDKACSGTCEACTAAKKGSGSNGTCGNIKYDTDPDNECVSGSCSGNATCQFFNGVACVATTECLSNYCVDGFCCGNACTQTCYACSAAKKGSGNNGSCGPIVSGADPDNECGANCNGVGACSAAGIGAACASNAECASGFCADGICCTTACTGTCLACNVAGSIGTCTNVPSGQNDTNGVPPCSGMCDGQGVCNGNAGSACTSGVQCGSRVCDNQVCAAVTPPVPLAWMTTLKQSTGSSIYRMDLARITTSVNGDVSGGGLKIGHFTLGPYNLYDCCYDADWWFSFSGTGYPTSLDDAWADDYNHTYTHQYSRIRYDNARAVYSSYHSGPGYSNSTNLSTPLWSRGFFSTAVTLASGDGGHVLIGATISPDDQNVLNPVDFGDGTPVTGPRLVKYGPSGNVEFNVPSNTLTVGPIVGPNGDFYAISRTATLISITKQNGQGVALWTKTYAATVAAGVTPAWAHAFDTGGNLYLAFNFNGKANLGNGLMTAIGIHDLGLAKLDVDGTVVWSKRFGTSTFDLQTVSLDPTGAADMLLRASFAGTAEFGNGNFTGSPVLAKFDATGTLVWRAPAPTGTVMVRGSESGAAFVVSTSKTADFGWGAPLAGSDVVGILAAKYGPCADPSTCRANGLGCGSNSQCESGSCVDGVCCNSVCTGLCQACSAAKKGSGSNGTCGPIAVNTDPDNECTYSCSGTGACAQLNGLSCAAPSECLSGNCVDGVCCGNPCNTPCMACSAAKKGSGANGSCGPIASGTDPDSECGTGTCSGTTGCSMGSLGVMCTAGSQCVSGFCADGVCCNAACSGTCQACTAAKKGSGANGTCGNIPDGADPDNECGYGTCSGSATCVNGTLGRPCAGALDCANGTYCVEGVCCNSICSGTCSSCLAVKKGSGSNGTCGNIAVSTDPDNECTNGACGGLGTCKSDIGLACTNATNCLSGFCVDNVCCDAACNGTCQACSSVTKGSGFDGACGNVAAGTDPHNTCALECDGAGACLAGPNGSICADGSQCTSGFCVDNFCCDSACTGTCAACSTAKKGSGTNGQCGFIGAGLDPENECASSCNGSGMCATPPVLLADGSACTGGALCTSGYCVDGVCCNSPCYETCKACNVPGLGGTCSPHAPGACNVCGGIIATPTIPATAPAWGRLATGDFDNDGFVDVATTDYTGLVTVSLGLGNGTFTRQGQFAIASTPEQIVAADLNADGALDLVTAGRGASTVSVLLNQGDGTFAPRIDYPVGGNPYGVAVADLNGDGDLDLATANYGSSGNWPQSVSILLGNGSGVFGAKIDSVFSGVYPESIAAADMTGDGIVDLAVTTVGGGTKSVYVLRGLGTGSFVYHDDFPYAQPDAEGYSPQVIAAELNGDGKIDLAISADGWTRGDIDIFFNLGDGTFGNPYTTTTPFIPYSIESADMNGDGKLDIVLAGTDRGDGFSVLVNGGAGTFTNNFFRTSATFEYGAPADLDNDGDMDLITSTQAGLVPFFNPGNGVFENDATLDAERLAKLADLNGDGKLDIVRFVGGLSVQLNQGNNTFAGKVTYGSAGAMVEVADINGDAKPDLMTVDTSSNVVRVHLNNGNGTFAGQTTYTTGGGPIYVVAADVTGDGKLDLAVANSTGNTMSVLRNNGNGTFAAKVDYATGTSPSKVAAADMNGDNIADFVVGADNNRNIDVAYNQGNGTFVVADFATSVTNPSDFVVKDLNGDGKADFAMIDGASPNAFVSVKRNQGAGTFASAVNYPLNNHYGSSMTLTTADIDGEGHPELCVFWTYVASFGRISGTMSVLFNQGGTFSSPDNYLTWSRTMADLNGDGVQDFIRADATNATVKYGTCLP